MMTMKRIVLALSAVCHTSFVSAAIRHRKLLGETENAIPGQYIVELYPDVDVLSVAETSILAAQEDGTSTQAQVSYIYGTVFNGFAVNNYAEQDLANLLNNPQVKTVWIVSVCCFCLATSHCFSLRCVAV
jgi:hypothetical protein